jgi:hypothetical protein
MKIKLLFASMMLLLSVSVSATELRLNLNNPDVRKCLLEASEYEGWELKAIYQNANEQLVYVFGKGNETKTYIGL